MLPSYKRPDRFATFYESAMQTAARPENIIVTLCRNFADQTEYALGKNVSLIHEDTTVPDLSHYFNMMYEAAGKQELVSLLGDDMLFLTQDWDTKVLDEINSRNGISFVTCNDNYVHDKDIPVNFFTTPELVDACGGEFVCPGFRADWIDTAWGELARLLECYVYLEDVVISHEHVTKTGKDDETYRRLRSKAEVDNVKMWAWIGKCFQNARDNFIL
jgi:hypothetical protein